MTTTTLEAPAWAPTLLRTPDGVPQLTKADIVALWTDGPRWRRGCDEEAFNAHYVRPVTAFGLSVCHDEHPGMEAWGDSRAEVPASQWVRVADIRYSTQLAGVLTSVVHDVIVNGPQVAPCDPEGWFNNRYPVLMRWPDGSMSVRDGNHRVVGARLRGNRSIRAHVIGYDWAPTS